MIPENLLHTLKRGGRKLNRDPTWDRERRFLLLFFLTWWDMNKQINAIRRSGFWLGVLFFFEALQLPPYTHLWVLAKHAWYSLYFPNASLHEWPQQAAHTQAILSWWKPFFFFFSFSYGDQQNKEINIKRRIQLWRTLKIFYSSVEQACGWRPPPHPHTPPPLHLFSTTAILFLPPPPPPKTPL